MDGIGSILSHQPSISTENLRAAQLSRWTKQPSFAPRIDFRKIVTKLPIRSRPWWPHPDCRSWLLGFLMDCRSLSRSRAMEQSWNNHHTKGLCFPAFA